MTDHQNIIRGEFDVFTAAKPLTASPVSKNPLSVAHAALIEELSHVAIPSINVNPVPEEFQDVADYVVRVTGMFDRWIKEVGLEVQSNATTKLDMRCFDGTFSSAVDGFALHELDSAAENCREDHYSILSAVRYGRTMGTIMDGIRRDVTQRYIK